MRVRLCCRVVVFVLYPVQGMVIVAVSVLLRSKRVPPVRVPIPSTTRRAGRSSRGYAKVTAAATDTIADHPEDDGKAVV